MTDLQADVVIVGGGPSGLTVAAELAGSGVHAVVLEKRGADPVTRAGTLLPRPLELFDTRGIADRFIRRACEIRPFPFVPFHVWGGARPVDWAPLQSRFGFTLYMPQSITEAVLRDWAVELGTDLRLEHTVEAVSRQDDGISVQASGPSDQTLVVKARYCIGADGGRSLVRRALGIPTKGHPPTFTGIIADVDTSDPLPPGRPGADNDRGWAACFPIGDGATRFVVIHREEMSKPQGSPVVLEDLKRCVNEIFEETVPISGIRWSSRYSDALSIADSFRSGQVFLLGEAARIHYPASGVGMNFCIQDAFNLGWKLSAVMNGSADEALLDTYETERRPVSLNLLRSIEAQVAMQFNFTAEGMALKRSFAQDMLPIPDVAHRLGMELNGTDQAYPSPAGSHPLSGRPVPDVDLMTVDGRPTRIAELLRDRRFVLFDFSGSDAYTSLDLGAAPVDCVRALAVRRPQSLSGVQSLLVRPDAYVAWASTGPPDPQRAAEEVRRWMRAPSHRSGVAGSSSR